MKYKYKYKYEWLLKWLKNTKEQLSECFDSKCGICGYDKTVGAMDFHHLNKDDKDFSISKWQHKNWKILIKEVQKCVLLCNRCHREVHLGITKIPYTITLFNTEKAIKIEKRKEDGKTKIKLDKCPMCQNMKKENQKYCSIKCNGKAHGKVEWNEHNLYDLVVIQKLPMTKIAKLIGVTDNSVRRKLRKLNLPITIKERKNYRQVEGNRQPDLNPLLSTEPSNINT